MAGSAAREQRPAHWLGLLAVLLVVLVVGLALAVPDGTVVDCERDGHFQRAGHLACGLTSVNAPYGPLLPYLVAPLIPIAGSAYLAGRVVSVLALLGLVLLSWHACRKLGGGLGLAALTALSVGLNGHLLYYGSMACSDLCATGFFVLAAWLALRSIRGGSSLGLAALAGMAMAAACLVRVQYYLAAPVLVVVYLALSVGPGSSRFRSACALLAGLVIPLGAGLLDGWIRYGLLSTALDAHLGLAAYTRNFVRAGAIIDGSLGQGGEAAVGLGARLAWSVRLVSRVTGGLPLLGLLGAVVLAVRGARWRAGLVVVLPALALYVGLCWSHPPPDWGARRFYLFLVPVCVVPFLLLSRQAIRRWFPGSRVSLPAAGIVCLVAVVCHATWDLARFRGGGPTGRSLLEPRGTTLDRAVFRDAELLSRGVEPCTPVLTNFHAATLHFRNAHFLGPVALDAEAAWLSSLPLGNAGEVLMVWAPPDAVEPVFPPRLGDFVVGEPQQTGSLWLVRLERTSRLVP